jgi:phage/plasmid-associated DNA primase
VKQTVLRQALHLGDLLLQAKAKVGHGRFKSWIENNCDLSERSAQRYMALKEQWPKIEAWLKDNSATVADLSLRKAEQIIAPSPFSEQFGMENFVGKKVAVFSDARLDGVLQRNLSTMTERLLMITGEDEIHINRKNKKYWNGKLATKVVTFSNELLRFQDESGALAGRFLTFRMQQSFYGREDENLTDKLLAERPGILNLALDALDELRRRGKLLQSESGVEMAERLGDLTSDVKVFVEECCEVGVNFQVRVSEIFVRWQDWCAQHNTRHGWGSNQFSEKLRSVVPTITSSRPRKDNPDRLTVFYGIGLKKKLPLLQRPVLG